MPSPASGLKTRQALLDVAKSLLGQGITDVTIGQIAQEAGVSVGSVYTYFKDKRELFDTAAHEAVLESYVDLAKIAFQFDDLALGFFAATLYACKRPEFDPQTARIIVEVGPIGFATFDEYLSEPTRAIQDSVDRGLASCEDVPAFVLAFSGAYQTVLAQYVAGSASVDLGERVLWLFAEQLGYSRDQYDEVVSFVNALDHTTL